MNKEELIRNLKYTEKKHRNDTVNTFDTDISMMCSDVLRVLKNCIEIPEGATNGDMIRAMFTGLVVIERAHFVKVYLSDRDFWMAKMWASFDLDWWNAPFKKGVEE